jgi:hypothetical protein
MYHNLMRSIILKNVSQSQDCDTSDWNQILEKNVGMSSISYTRVVIHCHPKTQLLTTLSPLPTWQLLLSFFFWKKKNNLWYMHNKCTTPRHIGVGEVIHVHHIYNKGTTPLSHGVGSTYCGAHPMWEGCCTVVPLLYMWCTFIIFLGVEPTHVGPSQCALELCTCCNSSIFLIQNALFIELKNEIQF